MIEQVFGIFLFFTPGILLSYILFPKSDLIKRIIFSVILSISIVIISGVLLVKLNLFNKSIILLLLSLIIVVFMGYITRLSKNINYKTNFNRDIWFLLVFTLLGTFWRIWFIISTNNFGDAYTYAEKFIGKALPDMGFYTGMAKDRSAFIGGYIINTVFTNFLSINNRFLSIFLINFLFLGFVYLVFSEYRNKEMAYLGIALMALGPVEIFHGTLHFFGHPSSYIALLSLFLLYNSYRRDHLIIAVLLAFIMAVTYLTSAVVNLITSAGFIIALFIKDLLKTRNAKTSIQSSFKNKKILSFGLIALISLSFIFGFFSIEKTTTKNVNLVTRHQTTFPIMKYENPEFMGLSAIRWQDLFFVLCGLTLITHSLRSCKLDEKDKDIWFCLIPISLVSLGFLYVNIPQRIFNYFAFFGVLALKMPKRFFKTFFILSFIFIVITGFRVVEDTKIFYETTEGEIDAALWVNNTLEGRLFSDLNFINQLIEVGYYNVTGLEDDDLLIYPLFYQNDSTVFLNAIRELCVDYVIVTDRMADKYILTLNVPQKHLINNELYKENLINVYDNGDARIYKVMHDEDCSVPQLHG